MVLLAESALDSDIRSSNVSKVQIKGTRCSHLQTLWREYLKQAPTETSVVIFFTVDALRPMLTHVGGRFLVPN